MPRFTDLMDCDCQRPRGAGADASWQMGMPAADYDYDTAFPTMDSWAPMSDVIPGSLVQDAGGTQFIGGDFPPAVAIPESQWPVGSVATLAAPFVADSGSPWIQNQTVQTFKKFSEGHWGSIPGNVVYYASLAALDLAAPVKKVDYPPRPPKPGPKPIEKPVFDFGIFDPEPMPIPELPPAPEIGMPKVYTGEPGDAAPARPKWLLPALAAGAGLLILVAFDRRKRR